MDVVFPIFMFLVGFAAGGAVIWFLFKKSVALAREQERTLAQAEVRVAEGRVGEREVRISELQKTVAARDHDLKQRAEEITQLKQDIASLQENLRNEQKNATEKLNLLSNAEETFILKLSEPVSKTLKALDDKIAVYDNNATNLGVETSKLVKALQKPHVRGQWGEMALERVFEIAGLTEGRDFYSQQTIGGEDSIQRPDFIVCLPGNKHLAIDAKAPISAFLEAAEETDDAVKSEKLGKFVSHVRKRVKELGGKSYDQALDNSPEFVVLYLPTEAVVSAALELDKKLLEYAYEQRVLLAGPTIIISLLFAVAHGWKQEVVEKHAKDIHELGKELYSRLATFGGHIGKLQTHLRGSVTAYNAFVGSLESSVMPQARRFEDYKAAPADKQLLELKQIEVIPRQLQGSDFANVEIDGEIKDPALSARPR